MTLDAELMLINGWLSSNNLFDICNYLNTCVKENNLGYKELLLCCYLFKNDNLNDELLSLLMSSIDESEYKPIDVTILLLGIDETKEMLIMHLLQAVFFDFSLTKLETMLLNGLMIYSYNYRDFTLFAITVFLLLISSENDTIDIDITTYLVNLNTYGENILENQYILFINNLVSKTQDKKIKEKG